MNLTLKADKENFKVAFPSIKTFSDLGMHSFNRDNVLWILRDHE